MFPSVTAALPFREDSSPVKEKVSLCIGFDEKVGIVLVTLFELVWIVVG